MKKEDLMIGDWVDIRCEGGPEDEHMYSQVEQLWDCEIDADFETDYDNVYPVPLTEEILGKNGFKKEDGLYIIVEHKAGNLAHDLCLLVKDNDFANGIINVYSLMHKPVMCNGSNETVKIGRTFVTNYCHCGYVHELQHVLKLNGIETEIVL